MRLGSASMVAVLALAICAAAEPVGAQVPASGSVRPIVECVEPPADVGEPYVARFGYLNEYASAQTIPVGTSNRLTPSLSAAIPTTFLPGRQVSVFTVEFSGAPLVWTITDPDGRTRTATASSGTKPCPPPCAPVSGDMLAWWRAENDIIAEIGPDLVGSASFGAGMVGRGLIMGEMSALTVDGFPTVRDAVSVEMWVMPTATGMTQMLISHWNVSGGRRDDAFALTINPYGELEWLTDGPTGRWPDRARVGAAQLFDGDWHHVAATWTAATTTVYVDGGVVLEKVAREPRLNEVATQFRVGSSSGRGNPFWFTGQLDEPTVWGRALSEAEVSLIFEARSAGKCRGVTG